MALFNFNRLTGKLMSQINDGNGEKTLTGSPINPVEPFRGIRPMPSNPRLGFFGGLGQQLAPLIQASEQPSRLGFKGPARPEDKRMATQAAFQEGAAAAPAPAPSEQAIMLQPQRPQPAFMNAVAQAGAQPPQGAQGQQGMPEFTDDQLRALAQMVARFMRI